MQLIRYVEYKLCKIPHVVRKRPGCVLVGACALIRMNTVIMSGQ